MKLILMILFREERDNRVIHYPQRLRRRKSKSKKK